MKQFWKQFALRGLIAMGFGPMVLAVIYACLGLSGAAETVTLTAAAKGILSLTALAFLCGGIGAIYSVEKLPAVTAALIHGAILYAGYLILYLFNDWIPRNPSALAIFTVIFVLAYALIWLIIYQVNKRAAGKLNEKLAQR